MSCSKCRTCKTAIRTVSVQVQRVNYQCQTRTRSHKASVSTQDPNYQCQTNEHDLIGFNVNTDTVINAEYIPTDVYLDIYVTG